jgi:hypothetical protein
MKERSKAKMGRENGEDGINRSFIFSSRGCIVDLFLIPPVANLIL